MEKILKSRKGWTLVEMIVVIAIAAIILVAVTAGFVMMYKDLPDIDMIG